VQPPCHTCNQLAAARSAVLGRHIVRCAAGVGAGRRNSHSEHEALREMKNELMAQWDGIRSGGASPSGPRIMVSRPACGLMI
jgi:hypothetical protein